MTSFLTSILAFVFAIGVLIAFHEFGHYWVARRCGVKVLRYSIGFGKPLWMRRAGQDQTEYVIAAIPLGGYVKMLDEREAEVPKEELHRAFNRQSVNKRMAIVAAGPVFNFIFAIFAYALMYVIGVPGIKPVIGEVEPQSIAYQAGIRANDQIVAVDGEQTPTWGTARMAMLQGSLEDNTIPLQLQKGDSSDRYEVSLPVDGISIENKQAKLLKELGLQVYRPPIPAVMGTLTDGAAAQRDGLQTGDKIIAVDNKSIKDWQDWVEVIRKSPETTLNVTIERSGQTQQIKLTPEALETDTGIIGRIGALPKPVPYPDELRSIDRHPVGTAFYTAVVKTWQMSALTLRMIGHMIVGDVSVKNLSGPITIATYAGYTASEGLPTFLSFLAIVSISLGVLNLLPIPLLDGGHLLFYVIEVVKGSALSEEVQLRMQHVGIVMLGMLMMLAFYNDIHRLFWSS
jgi:regulator of sigma E protease